MCSDIGEGRNVPDSEMDVAQQYDEEATSSSPLYNGCGLPIADTKCSASTQFSHGCAYILIEPKFKQVGSQLFIETTSINCHMAL